MPIYEYQCDDCGHTLEAIQKVSDRPLRECPECGEKSLRKLVSAAAFHLKGTGWYVTDFKEKPKAMNDARKPEEPAKIDSGASGTKKSDADTSKPVKKESASTTVD